MLCNNFNSLSLAFPYKGVLAHRVCGMFYRNQEKCRILLGNIEDYPTMKAK